MSSRVNETETKHHKNQTKTIQTDRDQHIQGLSSQCVKLLKILPTLQKFRTIFDTICVIQPIWVFFSFSG